MAKPQDNPVLPLHHLAIEGLAAAHTETLGTMDMDRPFPSKGRFNVVAHALPAAVTVDVTLHHSERCLQAISGPIWATSGFTPAMGLPKMRHP